MKAVIVEKIGKIDDIVFGEIPVAELNSDELLIKVKSCGINPADWKYIEAGNFNLPYIVGSDVSGVIISVGSKISNYKIGDEVVGSLDWTKQGAFAEFVITKEKFIVPKPANITFHQAASVPLVSLTAWQGLFDVLSLKKDEKLLIQAGAGGVGLFALQFAKLIGAYVAVTSSSKNVAFLKDIGADIVIDYTKKDFSNELEEFDCVLDSIDEPEKSCKILRKGGRYAGIAALNKELPEKFFTEKQITATKFLFKSDNIQLNKIFKLISENKINTFIDRVFEFENAIDALKYQKDGHSKGKNILKVSE